MFLLVVFINQMLITLQEIISTLQSQILSIGTKLNDLEVTVAHPERIYRSYRSVGNEEQGDETGKSNIIIFVPAAKPTGKCYSR